jgi:hypothetical protein
MDYNKEKEGERPAGSPTLGRGEVAMANVFCRRRTLFGVTMLLVAGLAMGGCRGKQDRMMTIEGGPAGGTFHVIAEGMAKLFEDALPGTRITVEHSGGSVYNLARIDSSRAGMGIVYASDAVAGMEGKLSAYPQPTSRVLAVARLYGGNAHLSVHKASVITNPFQLKGQRVGIGYPGSATAISAENYFRSLGIWETLVPDYVSYDMAADDFKSGRMAALWQMVGCPSASLARINRDTPIRLLDLGTAAKEAGFFSQYPGYTPSVIPAGSYSGIDYPVETFQDQALWVASAEVDEKFIYRALSVLFSEDGRNFLKKVHPVAGDLSLSDGHQMGRLPLHPGAARFWREQQDRSGFVIPGS